MGGTALGWAIGASASRSGSCESSTWAEAEIGFPSAAKTQAAMSTACAELALAPRAVVFGFPVFTVSLDLFKLVLQTESGCGGPAG